MVFESAMVLSLRKNTRRLKPAVGLTVGEIGMKFKDWSIIGPPRIVKNMLQ